MTEQWQELKETIIELRDSDGTGTQQEVCKFLANYMNILEKQIQKPSKQNSEWISVDDKLPEEGANVLVCNNSGEMRIIYGWYYGEENQYWTWDIIDDNFGSVVVWMPLPKPYRKNVEYIF